MPPIVERRTLQMEQDGFIYNGRAFFIVRR